MWCNHFIRHKIHTLWLFHAIHHSQEELNVFTDDRGHFIDELVGSLFTFIPFFVFQVSDVYAIMVIGIYMPIHNRFIHTNIKINLAGLAGSSLHHNFTGCIILVSQNTLTKTSGCI
ncbi:MAG: sterol desaturase family protein [Bacteroidota bacterium]